jgi:hypothetical protein
MVDRRNGDRKRFDMPVTKQMGDESRDCLIGDLSPSGIRLRRLGLGEEEQPLCDLELHLVPGSISTVVAARKVWQNDEFEAYQFVSPTFAQQAVLERMLGNY